MCTTKTTMAFTSWTSVYKHHVRCLRICFHSQSTVAIYIAAFPLKFMAINPNNVNCPAHSQWSLTRNRGISTRLMAAILTVFLALVAQRLCCPAFKQFIWIGLSPQTPCLSTLLSRYVPNTVVQADVSD